MAIAGIEGLAQGFMQGMALKRQNDRQDVLDAQNLEKFGMDKERFATQQAASAFELQNAQTNAANAAMDRTRNLRIQANQDAFDVKMKRLLSTGDDNLATLAEVEKVHIEDGVKGAFKRDPTTGVILTDKKGVATWVNADGSTQNHTGDSARKLFFEKQYPKETMERGIKTTEEIAKEGRDVTNSILKGAPKIASDERISRANNASKERQITLQLQYRTKQEKDAAISAFSPYISSARQILRNNKLSAEDLHNMKRDLTKDGFIQEGIRSFNAANATKKLTPEQIKAAQKEVTSLADALYGAAGATDATTSDTDTYDSTSQGKLVAKGLEGEAGAIELNDRKPVSVEKPSATKTPTAKPATPKSLTVPRPSSSTTPAKTYKGNAGTMLPEDYVRALGGAIRDALPVMPPPKQYPKDASFFGNEANPLDSTKRLGGK
ncbi:MAG: hypothetical protein WAT41_14365 [Flavobacteriales bacterium]